MNNVCIKPHIPECEDGFTLSSSDSSVSVTFLLFHLLPVLSLAKLLTAAVFHASSNEGGILQLFRIPTYDVGRPLHASKLVSLFNLIYHLGLPTDYIITSPYKYGAIPSFSDTKTHFRLIRSPPFLWHIFIGLLGSRI